MIFFKIVIIFFFSLFGLMVMGVIRLIGGSLARQVAAARQWPEVPGKVTYVNVSHFQGNHVPEVRYEYEVAGKAYKSTRVKFGGWRGSRELAHQFIAGYPPGKEVSVKYDPKNPGNAVLDTAGDITTYKKIAWGFFGLFAVFGLLASFIVPG
ncbi:MAG: DUF3592 domain-containing protein [Caulobacteraceae bacterium]